MACEDMRGIGFVDLCELGLEFELKDQLVLEVLCYERFVKTFEHEFPLVTSVPHLSRNGVVEAHRASFVKRGR